MEGLKCPRCGNMGICYCRDVGGVSYDDEYTFYCQKCGYKEKITRYGGNPCASDWLTYCPYCERACYQHEETPKKLW